MSNNVIWSFLFILRGLIVNFFASINLNLLTKNSLESISVFVKSVRNEANFVITGHICGDWMGIYIYRWEFILLKTFQPLYDQVIT